MGFIRRRKPSDIALDNALERLAAAVVSNIIMIHMKYGARTGVTQMGLETEDNIRQMEHNMKMTIEIFIGILQRVANTTIGETIDEWAEKIKKRGKK